MGTDIHAYIEYRHKPTKEDNDGRWTSFGKELNLGRNYLMFAILAGIGNWGKKNKYSLFEPKGLPKDLSWVVEDDAYYTIFEEAAKYPGERYCTAEKAAEWVKYGSWYKNHPTENRPWKVSHPDWHTYSWLTSVEFQQALNKYIILEQEQWERNEKDRKELIEKFRAEKTLTDEQLEKSWINEPFPHERAEPYWAALVAMQQFELMGCETRLVFWFDN